MRTRQPCPKALPRGVATRTRPRCLLSSSTFSNSAGLSDCLECHRARWRQERGIYHEDARVALGTPPEARGASGEPRAPRDPANCPCCLVPRLDATLGHILAALPAPLSCLTLQISFLRLLINTRAENSCPSPSLPAPPDL